MNPLDGKIVLVSPFHQKPTIPSAKTFIIQLLDNQCLLVVANEPLSELIWG